MFTGIVETTGRIAKRSRGALEIVPEQTLKKLKVGESIAVDGVCLTVDRTEGQALVFEILPETLRVTTLGKLKVGDSVNLERSVQAGERLGGHLLLGHVDGRGKLISRTRSGATSTLTIQVPSALSALMVPKGPIAVDGVSLTLDPKLERTKIRVHLIPHTASATSLGQKRSGEWVNLEVDLVAKYLHRML